MRAGGRRGRPGEKPEQKRAAARRVGRPELAESQSLADGSPQMRNTPDRHAPSGGVLIVRSSPGSSGGERQTIVWWR